MKKFFYVAIAATALASCSSDNLVDLKEGDEIKFTAVADNDSRAETVFCQNNLPSTFQLYAAAGANDFIVDEEYTRAGETTIYNRTGGINRYWPENDALDFYAFKNATINWFAGSAPTGTFEVEPTVESQLDFIYAANPDQTKATSNNGAVALNFRHALSQIEFKVVNNNPDLEIIVKNVKVGGALSKGNFTFPATTAEQWENHNQAYEDMTDVEVIAWASQNTPVNYTLANDFANVTVLSTDPATALTFETDDAEDADFTEIYEKSMLLLPQETQAWDGTEGGFLAVKCVINNIVKDENGDVTADRVVLYGDKDKDGKAEGRWAFVPVQFNWKPGYKYVYTFNFTYGGNAGYDDSNGNDKPGNMAVLLPLTVDVTVDDFQPTTGSTENMVK